MGAALIAVASCSSASGGEPIASELPGATATPAESDSDTSAPRSSAPNTPPQNTTTNVPTGTATTAPPVTGGATSTSSGNTTTAPSSTTVATTTTGSPATTNAPATLANVVGIVDFAFESPREFAVGTAVEWVNEDAFAHSVVAEDDSFDSDDLKPGDRFVFTFTAPGEFAYLCGIHPSMRGAIVVTD